MSDNYVSEGLVEFLQATSPTWATKLTMERLTFVRIIAEQRRTIGRLVTAAEPFAMDDYGMCVQLHHEKRDFHDGGDPCPVIKRLRVAIEEAKKP